MWLTLAAAGFFGIILLITLLRAERSVANGALTVITLLAIGVAATATIRAFGFPGGQAASADRPSSPSLVAASLPALACVDDLAGDAVLNACEKVLFGTAESTAAAVAYAASQISRLTSAGDVATANRNLTPELEALRRAVERDRYGLMAYVLMARDRCTSAACPAFRSLTNSRQVASNMDERVYEGLVVRYSGTWNAPPAAAAPPTGALAALPPGMPTGKPTNAEFPSASSTPAVSIMTPEPTTPPARAAAPPAAAPPAARPSPAPAAPASAAAPAPPAAPKKQPAPKSARAPTQAPTQLAPAAPPSSPPAPQAPAADNE
nr:hypothetical protein [Bradyrhizobium lablabi]